MSARMHLAAIAAAGLVAFAAAPPAAAQDAGESSLEEAHAAFLEDPAMQTERPESEPPERTQRPRDDTPNWLRDFLVGVGDFLRAIGPVFRILFYFALAAIVLAVLYFVAGETLNIRFFKRQEKPDPIEDDVIADYRPDAAAARSLLEEADALAKAGRYAEAVHLLLFRSIEDIQRRHEGGVPRSLTAREIGRLPDLPERPRRALSPIIAVVERSFFGGREVGSDGWASARKSYEDFAFGESWA